MVPRSRLPRPVCAILLPLLGACGGEAGKEADSRANRQTAEPPPAQEVRGTVLYGGDTLVRPQSIGIAGGWLLVGDVPRPHALHVIAKRDGRYAASWGREGKGPGEFSTLWGLQPAQGAGQAWLFDPGQNRLTLVDLRVLTAGGGDPLRRTIVLRSDLVPQTAVWISDTLLVSTGMFTRGRLAHFDSAGSLRRLVGPLPAAGPNVPAAVAQHAFTGTLVRHPTRPLVAIGTRHADRVEIYDADGELQRVARGPLRFEPVFRVQVRGGSPLLATGDDLRFGYVDLFAAGDRLYALYSGRTRGELPGRANFGDEVHVFDWDGNLREILKLDARALALAVDPAAGALYTVVHDPAPAVMEYPIPR